MENMADPLKVSVGPEVHEILLIFNFTLKNTLEQIGNVRLVHVVQL